MPDAQDAHPQRHSQDDARLLRVADEASDRALTKAFRSVGVDLNDIESVNGFRDDLRYLRRQREGSEVRSTERNKTLVTTIGGAIVGIVGSVAAWFLSGGHGGK